MKRIICIGESSLNIIFGADAQPQGSMPGGRIINAAAILARESLPVVVASEMSSDSVGQSIFDFIRASGADTSSVDRFTEGRSPLNIFMPDTTAATPGALTMTRYEEYPEPDGEEDEANQGFDIIWPRVDEDDVVLFGGYYAVDRRTRPAMSKFLEYCSERKAILVYLPGFPQSQEPRITRVMPQLLENLELADLVLTRSADLKTIFGTDVEKQGFEKHINFYCRSLVNIDAANAHISYFGGKEYSSADIPASVCRTLLWNAGAAAGVAKALFELGRPHDVDAPEAAYREALLRQAVDSAAQAAKSMTESWQNCP